MTRHIDPERLARIAEQAEDIVSTGEARAALTPAEAEAIEAVAVEAEQRAFGAEPETIDLTPTWSGILPGLLAVLTHGETVEARRAAEIELRRMARLADGFVELSATHTSFRRFGGDEVAEREEEARREARSAFGPAIEAEDDGRLSGDETRWAFD